MEEVRAYQLHLIAQKRSWSHINQVACALRFFYGITLGQKEAFERIVTGQEPEKLPPVLSPEEIVRFLEAVAGLRNRVALTTAYAAGLRVGEVVAPEGRRDRQQADADPRRERQGRQGSLCDAVAAAAGDSARLLAAGAARACGCFRPGAGESCQHRRSAGGLPGRAAAGADRQACDGPHAAAQLCHPSAGERDRHPHHPGAARPQPTWRRRPATPRSPPT